MTKKELQATVAFLGAVRGAVAELKWYGKDYNNSIMASLGESLEKAVTKFKKEAKI